MCQNICTFLVPMPATCPVYLISWFIHTNNSLIIRIMKILSGVIFWIPILGFVLFIPFPATSSSICNCSPERGASFTPYRMTGTDMYNSLLTSLLPDDLYVHPFWKLMQCVHNLILMRSLPFIALDWFRMVNISPNWYLSCVPVRRDVSPAFCSGTPLALLMLDSSLFLSLCIILRATQTPLTPSIIYWHFETRLLC